MPSVAFLEVALPKLAGTTGSPLAPFYPGAVVEVQFFFGEPHQVEGEQRCGGAHAGVAVEDMIVFGLDACLR